MYSTSRCNNPTYLCGPSKYPVSREADRAQNGKCGDHVLDRQAKQVQHHEQFSRTRDLSVGQ